MSYAVAIAAVVLALLLGAACTRVIVEPSPCDPTRPTATTHDYDDDAGAAGAGDR